MSSNRASRLAVPRAEPHDHAAVRRGGRRGEGLRAGAQVARAGADALPGAPARRRGRPARRAAGRQPLPEGPAGHHRPGAQPDQIAPRLGSTKGIHGSGAAEPPPGPGRWPRPGGAFDPRGSPLFSWRPVGEFWIPFMQLAGDELE